MTPSAAAVCGECGGAVPAGALACPACRKLMHSARLKAILAEAEAAEAAGDTATQRRLWSEAAALVPPETRQHAAVCAKLAVLQPAGEPLRLEPAGRSHPGAKMIGAAGLVAALAWKFKFLVAAVAAKGKLLLLGLTKMSTLGTMVLSLGAFWTQFGWWFALGLVLSIYVHEMGHVFALRQLGIPASAPTFIPFIGAFVRMKQAPRNAVENARIGLAGPVWGTAAAIGLFVAWGLTGLPLLAAIAHFAAWINLFNLTPVWQLDGSRGMLALGRTERIVLIAITVAAFLAAREGFLLVIALCMGFRLFTLDSPAQGDRRTLATFAVLIAVLAALLAIPAPAPSGQ